MNKYQKQLSKEIKQCSRILKENYKTVRNHYIKGNSKRICRGKRYCSCIGATPHLLPLNTAYCGKWSNYDFMCLDCHKESYDYYKELWNDYYSRIR
ncbi:TPA: hypothetical protein ACXDAZ_002519 [Clostridium botulinum]